MPDGPLMFGIPPVADGAFFFPPVGIGRELLHPITPINFSGIMS